MNSHFCDCERGGDCTRTTMCHVQTVADDLTEQHEAKMERLLAVVIETSGLIGAFENELREVVGHTNVACIKEKLADLDQTGQEPASQPALDEQKTTVTRAMAQMLIDAQAAHIEKDYEEVYHQIYCFAAELSDDHFEPWKGVEAIAASADSKQQERVAQLTAHRACGGEEHDPANGKIHGYCVVCLIPWPCEIAAEQGLKT